MTGATGNRSRWGSPAEGWLRVIAEFRGVPRTGPLGEAVWGSAYTGLLVPAPSRRFPAHQTPPPLLAQLLGMTQDLVASQASGGEGWLPALIADQPQNTQNKSLGRLKQRQTV